MRAVRLTDPVNFEEWRGRARELLRDDVRPDAVTWTLASDGASLFDALDAGATYAAPHASAPVPRQFLQLAGSVLAHSDPQRFGLLYRILWRISHGERRLLERITDGDVARVNEMQKSVRRDSHKMKAFVRFRERPAVAQGQAVYLSWFEPEHYIVERVAPFFVRRFAGIKWSIFTPYRSAHWNGDELTFAGGAVKADAAAVDVLEDLWRTYYANIFNPARLKITAMKSEMPVKYWKNLPEAQVIHQLIRDAQPRLHDMVTAEPTVPRKRFTAPCTAVKEAAPAGSMDELRTLAHRCRNCALWKPATQTVFGQGPDDARVVLVGEQPGDEEDLAGKPFIGPAGKLLDRALAEAQIDRSRLYITNTVKHFKFEPQVTPRGKRRLHKRANSDEQHACRPWLLAELARIKPRAVVCLGSMAASNLFGPTFRLLHERGQWRTLSDGTQAFATTHPSYLLRISDMADRAARYRLFVRDLRLLKPLL
jgi:uracil-DNA glycosylase